MASNSFGVHFRFTTWGESHGPALGVVIDGCPAGLALDENALNRELARRAPGSSPHATRRSEPDECQIMSGVFQGRTTGAPISLLIPNRDADSSKYEAIAHLLRPGHANATYLHKYGCFDYRGGGRASARETAGRVAAGAVARLLLAQTGVMVGAWLSAVGGYAAPVPEPCPNGEAQALAHARTSAVFAPCAVSEAEYIRRIAEAREQGDSVGGIVNFYATNVPAGLGEPVYDKLEARLASAMLSIPACRAFEIGDGFAAASLTGFKGNDCFLPAPDRPCPDQPLTASNHAGGVLGGISTGMPLYGRVAFKPTPSIHRPQPTADIHGNPAEFVLPQGSRHDPCVAVRAVPVVEAMLLVVLADMWLLHRCARVSSCW